MDMLRLLQKVGYAGKVEVDGEVFSSVGEAILKLSGYDGTVRVRPLWPLLDEEAEKMSAEYVGPPKKENEEKSPIRLGMGLEYEVTVRAYMAQPDRMNFHFHAKFNGGVPMPFRTMRGRVINRTEKMVKMDLYAYPTATNECLCCKRRITHPISRMYGVGPDCAQLFNIPRYESRDDLVDNMKNLRKQMKKIVWSGYIPNSAILSAVELTKKPRRATL